MEFLKDPVHEELLTTLIFIVTVGLPWWLFGSIPYFIGRRKRAAAAVRFLGLIAIAMQGFGAFLAGEFMIADLIAIPARREGVGSFWILPFIVWGVAFLLWVVAIVIALMSEPKPTRRRPVGTAIRSPEPDFEITD